jgi:GntR family transcriptional regulator/MocR family aminotransferase
MRTPIVVNRRAATPLQRQIYDAWRDGILEGRFRRGDRMPSTRELAVALRVSRATVAAAYDQLIAEGYLDTRHGSGTFVTSDLPEGPHLSARPHAVRARARPPARVSAFAGRLSSITWRPPVPAGSIDISTDGPSFAEFPFDVWKRLMRRHLHGLGPSLFHYASGGAGHPPLRAAIAEYLQRSRAVVCEPDQILVTNGSQQALDLCARVLIDAGDVTAVEDPSYLGARQLFAAGGARLSPVAVDDEGLRVHEIPASARLVYITPSHQFPTGASLSLSRRFELLEWSRARRAVIIEDDYDSEYRYSGAPLPALQGLNPTAAVVYVGTFSNVMFPGLRLGYLVLPPELVTPMTRAKWLADRHTAHLDQAALTDFIREGHLERHIRRMRRLYKIRREVMIDALQRRFGEHARVLGDAAGMHMVVRFDSASVEARAARAGVHLVSTRDCYLGPAPAHEYILRFAGPGERTIREAIRRLAG